MYYIILDGYARADTLMRECNFDNSQFIDFLLIAWLLRGRPKLLELSDDVYVARVVVKHVLPGRKQ